MGLCLGPYGGPRGVAVYDERGTPVGHVTDSRAHLDVRLQPKSKSWVYFTPLEPFDRGTPWINHTHETFRKEA